MLDCLSSDTLGLDCPYCCKSVIMILSFAAEIGSLFEKGHALVGPGWLWWCGQPGG